LLLDVVFISASEPLKWWPLFGFEGFYACPRDVALGASPGQDLYWSTRYWDTRSATVFTPATPTYHAKASSFNAMSKKWLAKTWSKLSQTIYGLKVLLIAHLIC